MFAALTENEQQLHDADHTSKRRFDATAARNEALAETIRIFPTFLDESKATLARLQTFSTNTDPLVQRPAAGRRATSSRRSPTCTRWRPTSSTSSATSTR